MKQYTNELTSSVLALIKDPFSAEPLVNADDEQRHIFKSHVEEMKDRSLVTIWRFATAGSLTRNGGKKVGPNHNRQETVGCQVSCGKHPGKYNVAGDCPGIRKVLNAPIFVLKNPKVVDWSIGKYGLATAIVLNETDDKFGVTDKVITYIEPSQREFIEKARETEHGMWDLGAMLADRMLDKGKEFIEYEVRMYLRESLREIMPRHFQ